MKQRTIRMSNDQAALLLELTEESIRSILDSPVVKDIEGLAKLFAVRDLLRTEIPTARRARHRAEPTRARAVSAPKVVDTGAARETHDKGKAQWEQVLEALQTFPDRNFTADELAVMTGLERKPVSAYLSTLVDQGKAIRISFGKYKAA